MEIVNVLGYQTSIESLLLDMNNFYLGQLGFTINAFVHQKGRFLPTISVDSVGGIKSWNYPFSSASFNISPLFCRISWGRNSHFTSEDGKTEKVATKIVSI